MHRDEARGLDHGAYVPLVEMFPDADVPVLQMSMPTLDPRALFRLGQKIAPLRDAGTLIVGSGFTTHNLREFNPASPQTHPRRAGRASSTPGHRRRCSTRTSTHCSTSSTRPRRRVAHPRTEHFAPLFVSLGAAYGADGNAGFDSRSVIEGFWFGLSKRSWQLG